MIAVERNFETFKARQSRAGKFLCHESKVMLFELQTSPNELLQKCLVARENRD
jgi:hypothetical protein